jgi:hypothetical protein
MEVMDKQEMKRAPPITRSSMRSATSEEIADLEDYARRDEEPPRCMGYRFKVNGQEFIWKSDHIKDRQVLELAGPTHIAFQLNQMGGIDGKR